MTWVLLGFNDLSTPILGLPSWRSGKESACQCMRCKRCRFYPRVRKIPWRRKQQPTPVYLPEKFHGQRNLAGYSPWGCKQLDTTERLTHYMTQQSHSWACTIIWKDTFTSVFTAALFTIARTCKQSNVHQQRMDKEDAVCMYNEILLGHKNEWNNAICHNMDGPRIVILSEVRQRKTDIWYSL